MKQRATLIATPEEETMLEFMVQAGTTDREVLTQLLCYRHEAAEREPVLDLLVPIWHEILPKETLPNLRTFLEHFYTEAADGERQGVRLGDDGRDMMDYAVWLEQALSPHAPVALGEQLRECILNRDRDKWLKGLLVLLDALPRPPKQGDSIRELMLSAKTQGSAKAAMVNILKKFDEFCHKNKRLPTVGELNFECDLNKDNALRYREKLGLKGIPSTKRGKKG